jgi:hypothetical protein
MHSSIVAGAITGFLFDILKLTFVTPLTQWSAWGTVPEFLFEKKRLIPA